MKLGLDLRGGVHFLMQVDVNSVMQQRVEGDLRGIGQALRDQRIRYSGINRRSDNQIVIQFRAQDALNEAFSFVNRRYSEFTWEKNVVDNDFVLTEWKQPTVQPDKVVEYDLYRSTDNTNFSFMSALPPLQTDYSDHNVDVQKHHYFYKIEVKNTCDIDEALSGETSTILLKGEMSEERTVDLKWTPYQGWESGVEYYIIEKKDDFGSWQLLKKVDGNILDYTYQD